MHTAFNNEVKTYGDPALLNRIAWDARWACREKSISYASAALKLASEGDSTRARCHRGLALLTLSWQSKWRGHFDDAMEQALKVEELLSEKDHPRERAQTYSILAVVHYSRNRLDLARCSAERGIELVDQKSGGNAYVDLLTTLASIERYKGDRSSAGLLLGRAGETAKGAELARVEQNVARWMLADNSPIGGLEHAETALKLAIRHKNRVVNPYVHEIAGACLVALKDFGAAEKHFAKGMKLADTDCDDRARCQITQHQARMERTRGNLEKARDLFLKGAKLSKELDYSLWDQFYARALADVFETLGDLDQALKYHKRAWTLSEARRT
ncbi:MAG: hypothetical protein GKR98_11150 [Boseongicola sp.]|nr:MAG: hypothetical protein GKR98_11150 [Boseongicola sp.]